jgi:hypothetical protein
VGLTNYLEDELDRQQRDHCERHRSRRQEYASAAFLKSGPPALPTRRSLRFGRDDKGEGGASVRIGCRLRELQGMKRVCFFSKSRIRCHGWGRAAGNPGDGASRFVASHPCRKNTVTRKFVAGRAVRAVRRRCRLSNMADKRCPVPRRWAGAAVHGRHNRSHVTLSQTLRV